MLIRNKVIKNKNASELSSEALISYLVPKAGLEPARGVTTLDFESSASANSATSARFYCPWCHGTIVIIPWQVVFVNSF